MFHTSAQYNKMTTNAKKPNLNKTTKTLTMQGTADYKANIAIVGAGPAGSYCALQLIEAFRENACNNYHITLFDQLDTLTTILPTGNGRCNLTFDETDFKKFASYYPRGEKFLYSILSRYSTLETRSYFEKIGIKTYTQPDRRVFPVSNSAKTLRTP